jgi:hypothetical protein
MDVRKGSGTTAGSPIPCNPRHPLLRCRVRPFLVSIMALLFLLLAMVPVTQCPACRGTPTFHTIWFTFKVYPDCEVVCGHPPTPACSLHCPHTCSRCSLGYVSLLKWWNWTQSAVDWYTPEGAVTTAHPFPLEAAPGSRPREGRSARSRTRAWRPDRCRPRRVS